jgi:signal transduction histidine kinase
MGGSIEMESPAEGGSLFFVHLPAPQASGRDA